MVVYTSLSQPQYEESSNKLPYRLSQATIRVPREVLRMSNVIIHIELVTPGFADKKVFPH